MTNKSPNPKTSSSDSPEHAAGKTPIARPGIDLVTGAAMGLLVGTLIGLSAVPVVSGVITSLTALVGAFFGLAAPGSERFSFSPQPLRIAGFGVVCVMAIIGGIALRTSGALQVPIKPQLEELIAAGFEARKAQELVAYRVFGLVPSGQTTAASEVTRASIGALYATRASVCNQISRARGMAIAERLKALSAGGDDYALLVERVARVDQAAADPLLDALETVLCGS